MRHRTEHPLLHVVVELVVLRGIGHGAPVRDVLAVAPDRQARRVATARVSAVRRFYHGEDAVAGQAHPVPEPFEIVDDTLDGCHDATPSGPRAPHPVEEGLGEGEVPRGICGRRVHQRDVGRQGLEQTERTERGVDHRERLVVGHGRADQRPGHRRGQSPGGCLQALGQREDGPVLDLDLAGFVGRTEDRVRRVGRKAVTRIGRDDPPDQTPAEEESAEGAQTGHDERETRVGSPEQTGQLAPGRRPAAVPEHQVDGVPGPDAARHGIFERCDHRAVRCRDPRSHNFRFSSGHRTRNAWSSVTFAPDQT